MEHIKVLLADDHVLFVESLKNILEMRTADISVVAMAQNGEEAVELADKTLPDVILMDIRMPVMDGVEACALIHKKHPEIRIVMLTTFDDDQFIFSALAAGSSGYLLKTLPPDELINSIRAMKSGVVQISPSIATQIAQHHYTLGENASGAKTTSESHNEQSGWEGQISVRERDILRCLIEGMTNKEIGAALHISEQTVKNHLSLIYSRMNVRDRSQAIIKAMNSQLIRDVSVPRSPRSSDSSA